MKSTLFRLFTLCTAFVITSVGVYAQNSITPETALKSYINNGDKSFKWEVKDSLAKDNVTMYNLVLTSQKWREFTWRHQ